MFFATKVVIFLSQIFCCFFAASGLFLFCAASAASSAAVDTAAAVDDAAAAAAPADDAATAAEAAAAAAETSAEAALQYCSHCYSFLTELWSPSDSSRLLAGPPPGVGSSQKPPPPRPSSSSPPLHPPPPPLSRDTCNNKHLDGAGHSRQLLRQRDNVLRPNKLSLVALGLYSLWQLRFEPALNNFLLSCQRSLFTFLALSLSRCEKTAACPALVFNMLNFSNIH